MAKRLLLATRALGGEPGLPEVQELADWIAEHRGRMADIVTYLLERSLAPQISAGIGTPCAGGRFYARRLLSVIDGVEEGRAVREIHADLPEIVEDAAGIVVQRKGAWCALPAPHALGIHDDFYQDPDEWNDAICGVYRTILRSMRDTGVFGHVLICDRADADELAALARQKVFFFQPGADREGLGGLLEYQPQVAVEKKSLGLVPGLKEEYTVKRLCILDPDPAAIRLALAHFDPEQVIVAGYRTGDEASYWEGIVSSAWYSA